MSDRMTGRRTVHINNNCKFNHKLPIAGTTRSKIFLKKHDKCCRSQSETPKTINQRKMQEKITTFLV